jgi:hypothetical protein
MPTDTIPPKPVRDTIAALPRPELIRRYEGGGQVLNAKVLQLDDAQLDTFFQPEAGVGRWSCRALVGHLADAEIVLAHRTRRQVAEDRPVFGLWDEDAFVASGLYGIDGKTPKPKVAGYVAVIHTMRLWMAEWLRGLPDAAWARQGMHPERGPLTVTDQVAIATWHVEYHGWFLDRKLERLTG